MNDIKGSIQLNPGSYKSGKPNNFTRFVKIHLKGNCIDGATLDGVRQPFLYSLTLDKPPRHKIYKEPRVKLLKKIIKSGLPHIMFYLEGDNYKPVVYHNDQLCQLIKI